MVSHQDRLWIGVREKLIDLLLLVFIGLGYAFRLALTSDQVDLVCLALQIGDLHIDNIRKWRELVLFESFSVLHMSGVGLVIDILTILQLALECLLVVSLYWTKILKISRFS